MSVLSLLFLSFEPYKRGGGVKNKSLSLSQKGSPNVIMGSGKKGKKKSKGGGGGAKQTAELPKARVPLTYDQCRQARRRKQRTIFKAQVTREMEKKEKEIKEMLEVQLDNIQYAGDSFDAFEYADKAIKDLDRATGRVLVGFDTEGSIKTLQLYFGFKDKEYSQIYHLNKFLDNERARLRLRDLLLHEKIVFTGKSVNDELIDVLQMCGVLDVYIESSRIIESQRCFEVVELAVRNSKKALAYLEHGQYSPSFHFPKDPFVAIDKQKQENLGLKTIFKLFLPRMTMSKCYEMRCPYWVDWACLFEPMTDEMKKYAAGDAAAGLRIAVACGEALNRLGMSWEDLIETVDMEMIQDRNGPFLSGRLAAFFRRAVESRLSEEEEDELRRLRRIWESRLEDAIIAEREVRIERRDRVKQLQDAWDDANGYDRCQFENGFDYSDMTHAQSIVDDEMTEFEAVKHRFDLNTDMHKHACYLLALYGDQLKRIKQFDDGIDIEEAEAATQANMQKTFERWRKEDEEEARKNKSQPEVPLLPSYSTVTDAEVEERRRRKEEEKSREEEDPDKYYACAHLKEMLDKKTEEAMECIRQQREEKERKKAEEEKEGQRREKEERKERRRQQQEKEEESCRQKEEEIRRQQKEEEEEEIRRQQKEEEESRRREEQEEEIRRQQNEEEKECRRQQKEERKERRRQEKEEEDKGKENKKVIKRMKEYYYQWEKSEYQKKKEEDEKIETSRQRMRQLREELEKEKGHLEYLIDASARREVKTETERERLLSFIDSYGKEEEDENVAVGETAAAADVSGGGDDDDEPVPISSRQFVVSESAQLPISPDVIPYDEDTQHEMEQSESLSSVEINPDDIVNADEFVFQGEKLVLSEDESQAVQPAPVEAVQPSDEEEPPAKKAKSTLGNDVFVLKHCRDEEVEKLVNGIFTDTKRLRGDLYFIKILREMDDTDRKAAIALSVRKNLKLSSEIRNFCLTLIKERIIFEEFLKTANLLSFYEIDPILAIDHIHHKNPRQHLLDFASAYPAEVIENSVRELCELADRSEEEVVSYLQNHDAFPADYLSDRQKRLGRIFMLKVARELCDAHNLQYPPEVKSFPLDDLVRTACHTFAKGETEMSDVIQDLEDLQERCGETAEEVLYLLRLYYPRLAVVWADKHGFPQAKLPENAEPLPIETCNNNARLHALTHDARIVFIDSKEKADLAIRDIEKSQYVVAHVCSRLRKYFPKEFQLLSVLTDRAMHVLHLPRMEKRHVGNFIARMRSALNGRRILIKEPSPFYELILSHVRDFPGAIDVNEVGRMANYPNMSWEGLSGKLTQGALCTRGSQIPSGERPSRVAIDHECIRLSLVYEFFRQNEPMVFRAGDSDQASRAKSQMARKRKLK